MGVILFGADLFICCLFICLTKTRFFLSRSAKRSHLKRSSLLFYRDCFLSCCLCWPFRYLVSVSKDQSAPVFGRWKKEKAWVECVPVASFSLFCIFFFFFFRPTVLPHFHELSRTTSRVCLMRRTFIFRSFSELFAIDRFPRQKLFVFHSLSNNRFSFDLMLFLLPSLS